MTGVLLALNLAAALALAVLVARDWLAERKVERNLAALAGLISDRPHLEGLVMVPCAGGHLLLADGFAASDWDTMHAVARCQPLVEALP